MLSIGMGDIVGFLATSCGHKNLLHFKYMPLTCIFLGSLLLAGQLERGGVCRGMYLRQMNGNTDIGCVEHTTALTMLACTNDKYRTFRFSWTPSHEAITKGALSAFGLEQIGDTETRKGASNLLEKERRDEHDKAIMQRAILTRKSKMAQKIRCQAEVANTRLRLSDAEKWTAKMKDGPEKLDVVIPPGPLGADLVPGFGGVGCMVSSVSQHRPVKWELVPVCFIPLNRGHKLRRNATPHLCDNNGFNILNRQSSQLTRPGKRQNMNELTNPLAVAGVTVGMYLVALDGHAEIGSLDYLEAELSGIVRKKKNERRLLSFLLGSILFHIL